MDFGYAIEVFKRTIMTEYAKFDNRVSRRDYWYFILIYMILYIGLAVVASIIPAMYIVVTIFALGIMLPSLGLAIRRMHDINKSGWWILVPIYNLWLVCQPGDKGSNQHGDDPLGGTADVFT